MPHILVAGLNPAWQKVLELPSLHVGEVNRGSALSQFASGKGINVAKVLRRLGHEVSLLQIVGGVNGDRCLRGCADLGVRSLHARVDAETRQCLTLMDAAGTATEIIEPFAVGSDVRAALLAALPRDPGAFDALVLSGTIPAGGPPDIYDLLLERYKPRVSVLDSSHPLRPESLGRVGCVKVNRKEYESLPAAARARGLYLVTDGAGEAYVLRDGVTQARFAIPRLEKVRNPIGAGDTVAAGVVNFLLSGLEPAEAFRRALAMGSASCLFLEPAEFADAAYESLLPRVTRV